MNYLWRSGSSPQPLFSRFTDFLVFEVDQENKVLHLTSIDKPDETQKSVQKKKDHNVATQSTTEIDKTTGEASESGDTTMTPTMDSIPKAVSTDRSVLPASATLDVPSMSSSKEGTWTDHITATLTPLLPSSTISQLKELFLQGPEPPLVSDSGWGGRSKTLENTAGASNIEGGTPTPIEIPSTSSHARDREGRGGGRGGRGARGDRGRTRGRGGRFDNDSTRLGMREDLRKVVSDVSTLLFKAVRHLLAYPPCIDEFVIRFIVATNFCHRFLVSSQ